MEYTHALLAEGEEFTTEVMKPGDVIKFDEYKTYTVAAEGKLTFRGVGYKEENLFYGNIALVSGTVQVPYYKNGWNEQTSPVLSCTGQNKDDSSDDVYVMNYTMDTLTVKVEDGKVTSITGFKSYKDSDGDDAQVKIVEENGNKATCYTYKSAKMDVLKKETGTFNQNTGFKSGKDKASYIKISNPGGNILSGNTPQISEPTNGFTAECYAYNNYNQPSDSLFIQNYSRNKLTFKVQNDKLVSISGLKAEGDCFTVKEGAVAIRYTCFGEEGKVFRKEIGTFDESDWQFIPGSRFEDTTYTKLAKAGGDVCAGEYQTAALTKLMDLDFSNPGTTTIYYSRTHGQGLSRVAENTLSPESSEKSLRSAVIEKDGDKYFAAAPTEAYLGVTVTTEEKDGQLVSTINIDVLRADYVGNMEHSNERWGGTVEIDAKGAVVQFTKPKNVYWNVHIKNAAANSIFTGTSSKDQIDYKMPFTRITGPGQKKVFLSEENFTLKKGTYTIFTKNEKDGKIVSEKRTLNVVGNVTVKISAEGRLLSLSGLGKGEKVTLTEPENGKQLVTTYEYVGNGYMKTEVLTAKGQETKKYQYKDIVAAMGTDILANSEWHAYKPVTQEFDKDASGGTVYFAVNAKGASVNLNKTKTSMTSVGSKSYVAMTVSETGEISAIQHEVLIRHDFIEKLSDKLKGTLTIAALADKPMYFTRKNFEETVDDTAVLKFTGAAADSEFVLGNNDTVTTAKLKADENITVNNKVFTTGTAGVLTIKGTDDKAALVSGIVKLSQDNNTVTVGSTEITSQAASVITVTAGAKGSFTIGQLQDGESFQVDDTTYVKAGDKLYTGTGENLRMFTMGKKSAITSAQLNVANARLWKQTEEQEGADIINLALAEKAGKDVSYVVDKYKAAKAENNKNAAATVIPLNETYQYEAGKTTGKTYTTVGNAGQTIKLANGWTANAGAGDDTLYGAVGPKAEDTINGGAGTNTIRLNTAVDIVYTGAGNDTIYGYAAGKDIIKFNGKFTASVDKNDAVLTSTEENSTAKTTIKSMANGKAVNINGSDYYFGRNANAKTANTFTYKDRAYYIGNEKTDASSKYRDTLKVTTADAQAKNIDLTKSNQYVSIDAVDASGMKAAKGTKASECKGVEVTAGETALRFTGSKFSDTVTCGSGRDYISTGMNQGADTINSFGVDDIIQVNGLNAKVISSWKKDGIIDENNNLTKDTLTLGTGSLSINTAGGTKLHVEGNKIKGIKA